MNIMWSAESFSDYYIYYHINVKRFDHDRVYNINSSRAVTVYVNYIKAVRMCARRNIRVHIFFSVCPRFINPVE